MQYDPIEAFTIALEKFEVRMDARDEKLEKRLDKQDSKIDGIIKTLELLVKVDIENKEIKESLGRAFKRIETMEHQQTSDGCPAHKAFLAVRAEQLKAFESLADECEEKHEAMHKRLEILEQKPLKAMDKVWMAILGALGTGVGGWLLLKFGVSTK